MHQEHQNGFLVAVLRLVLSMLRNKPENGDNTRVERDIDIDFESSMNYYVYDLFFHVPWCSSSLAMELPRTPMSCSKSTIHYNKAHWVKIGSRQSTKQNIWKRIEHGPNGEEKSVFASDDRIHRRSLATSKASLLSLRGFFYQTPVDPVALCCCRALLHNFIHLSLWDRSMDRS